MSTHQDVIQNCQAKIDCSPGKDRVSRCRFCTHLSHVYISCRSTRYRIVCSCFFLKNICLPHTESENTHSMTFQCWKWVHHWRSTMTPGGRTGLDLGRPLRPCAGHGVSRWEEVKPRKAGGLPLMKPLNSLELSKNDVSGRILYSWEVSFFLFHVECRKPLFILLEAACAQYGSHLSARDQDIPSQTSFFWFQTGIR